MSKRYTYFNSNTFNKISSATVQVQAIFSKHRINNIAEMYLALFSKVPWIRFSSDVT